MSRPPTSGHFRPQYSTTAQLFQEQIEFLMRHFELERVYSSDRRLFRGEDVRGARDKHGLVPRLGLTAELPREMMFAINRALLRGFGL